MISRPGQVTLAFHCLFPLFLGFFIFNPTWWLGLILLYQIYATWDIMSYLKVRCEVVGLFNVITKKMTWDRVPVGGTTIYCNLLVRLMGYKFYSATSGKTGRIGIISRRRLENIAGNLGTVNIAPGLYLVRE